MMSQWCKDNKAKITTPNINSHVTCQTDQKPANKVHFYFTNLEIKDGGVSPHMWTTWNWTTCMFILRAPLARTTPKQHASEYVISTKGYFYWDWCMCVRMSDEGGGRMVWVQLGPHLKSLLTHKMGVKC